MRRMRLFSVLLVIVLLFQSIPFVGAAEVIPVVDLNKKTDNKSQYSVINGSVIKMVLTETVAAKLSPFEKSKNVYMISGGTVVDADIHSLGNPYITIIYNGNVCYIECEKAKVIVGNSEELTEKINAIKEQYQFPAEGVIEVQSAPTHYSVNGAILYYNYQDFIWTLCVEYGIEEHFPILLCQFYQESRFKQDCVSATNDHGICQLNARYHDAWERQVGHPEWDVKTDPYANMYIGVYLMANKIKNRKGNIDIALTDYNAGGGYYAKYGIREVYVNHVRNWEKTLKALD